ALGASRHSRGRDGDARQRDEHLLGARLRCRSARSLRPRQLRELTLRLAADPSPFWMGTLAVAGLLLGLICIAPLGFVLAGTSGFIRMDLGILLVALPTAGLAVPSFILAHVAWQDLTLARPVLVIDESGIFD